MSEHSMRHQLTACLKALALPTARACWSDIAQTARAESYSYEQYLLEVMVQEQETRGHNRIARLLRESKLPMDKQLSSFDRKRLSPKLNAQLSALLDGSFLDRRENILAFGNPGSGKTHLLCALAHELVQQGHRVLFTTTSLLVQQLLTAKKELKLARILKRFSRYEALIIDDIGYVQQSREEMEVLFTLLADRYERGSILLTSNLPFSKWEQIFKDPMTTAAAIDRLVHHSVILELNMKSYRLAASQNNHMTEQKGENDEQ